MKKTLVSLFLVMALLVTAIAPAFAYTMYYSACPNGKPLNVRQYPSKSSSKLGEVAYGNQVAVEAISDGWAQIVWGSYGSAYVQASLLSKKYPGTKPSSSSGSSASYSSFKLNSYDATIKPARASGSVTVYWTPSTNGTKIESLYSNDSVKVLAQTSSWVQIYDETNGVAGFVLKKYIEKAE